MLVIDTNFGQFDLREDKWAVVVVLLIFVRIQTQCLKSSVPWSRKSGHGDSLFDYFKSLNAKQAVKGLIGYFEFKPGAFGVSVDVKAILSDLGESIQRRRPK